MLAGGAASLLSSQYVGISIAGFAGRFTVFVLAMIMVTSKPSRSAVRLWVYFAIAGTSLMCAVGLFYFYRAFGFPTTLASLPLYRVSAAIVDYQKATYGFASNTVDLLMLTTPVVFVLTVSKRINLAGRLFMLTSAALMVANLLISFERWAWICLGLAFLLTTIYYRRRLQGLFLLCIAATTILILGASVWDQLGNYFSQATDPIAASNLTQRVQNWSEGIQVLLANPAGVGLGTAGTLSSLSDTSSHNLFIDIGIEGGVLALAGSLLWALSHIKAFVGIMALGYQPKPDHEWQFSLLLGSFIFIAFGIFFNSLLYFSGLMVWLAFWWCFPVMAQVVQGSEIEARERHVDKMMDSRWPTLYTTTGESSSKCIGGTFNAVYE